MDSFPAQYDLIWSLGLLIPLVVFAIGALIAYVVIRLAVTHAILAADRKRGRPGDAGTL